MNPISLLRALKYIKATNELFHGNPIKTLLEAYMHGYTTVNLNGGRLILNINELITLIQYYIMKGTLGGLVINSDYIEVNGFKFIRSLNNMPLVNQTLIDVFINEAYAPIGFNYSNEAVLDVGAYIGDSSFYFIKKGAKIVHAVEPIDAFYNALLINIKLNNLEGKVNGIHRKVGELNPWPRELTGSLTSSARGIRLKELWESTNAGILKMDCEGCEWWVLNNEPESFKLFKVVIIEVHGKVKEFTRRMSKLGMRLVSIKRTQLSNDPIEVFIKSE